MMYIIDRFEEDYAICETDKRETVDIKRELLPPDAKEGDVIKFENDIYTIEEDETQARKIRIRNKMKNLWKK